MKIISIILVLLLGFISIGCDREFEGKVVDAETDKPIEEAVVLVEWTVTKGVPGLTHTESVKVIEAITDKAGKFTITGALKHTPHVTIYKKGYVAWNNKFIFPDYKKRKDFKLENGQVFKLERFKESFGYVAHESFITSAINVSLGAKQKQFFLKEYRSSEEELVIKERNRKYK